MLNRLIKSTKFKALEALVKLCFKVNFMCVIKAAEKE